MPATVRITLPRFPDPLIGQAVMKEIGDFAVRLIRTRTEQGKDVEGNAFLPLSPGYAAIKAKELGTTAANLTVSGRMLNDMRVIESSGNKVTLGFVSQGGRAPRGKQTLIQRSRAVGAADKAYWHHVSGAGDSRVKRKFFDLSDANASLIRERLQKHLDEIIRRVGGG